MPISIALCSKAGIPSDNDERMTYCQEMLEPGMMLGMEAEDLWSIRCFCHKGYAGKQAEMLEFLKMLSDMGFNSTGGLSNVSNGMPKHVRPIVDSAMIAMAIAGRTYLRNPEPMRFTYDETIKSCDIIKNNFLYADSFLEM